METDNERWATRAAEESAHAKAVADAVTGEEEEEEEVVHAPLLRDAYNRILTQVHFVLPCSDNPCLLFFLLGCSFLGSWLPPYLSCKSLVRHSVLPQKAKVVTEVLRENQHQEDVDRVESRSTSSVSETMTMP